MHRPKTQPNNNQIESESIAYRIGSCAEAVIGPGDRPLIELWHKGYSIVIDAETKEGRVVYPNIKWEEGVTAAEEAVKNRTPVKWPDLPTANDNRDFCINPFNPDAAGGLLESIAQWSLDSSRRPVPEFAMMAAIGFLSALYGRRYVGPTGAGLNVYMVGIADPGFGKEEPLKLIQNLGRDCKQMKLIGPGDVTAGSAIEKVLRRQPVQILPMDEFGVILESVNGKGASNWAKTIRKALLELYSKSTSIWSGKEYADPSRSAAADPIFAPTLSLLGMSTPTTFYAGLTEASLSDGFLARLTVMHVKKRPARASVSGVEKTPSELVAAIKKSLADMPIQGIAAATADNYAMEPVMLQVEWDNEAAEMLWISLEERQYDLMDNHGGQVGIIGRTAEQTIKYATIRALSRDTLNPRVTERDIHWGYAIVQRSIDCIETGVEEYLAGSPFQELCNAILRALRESKDGQMAHKSMLRKKGIGIHDQRMVKSAYDRLVEMGEIERPQSVNGGLRVKLKDRTK